MNWLKEIFSKDKCNHDWSKWEVTSVKSNSTGNFVFVQQKKCTKCGLSEFKTTRR